MAKLGQISHHDVAVGIGCDGRGSWHGFYALWLVLIVSGNISTLASRCDCGGVVVFFAAILLLVIAQQSRAVPLKSNNLPEQTADDPTAQLGAVIGDIVAKSNVKSSDFVLTALIAGIVLGASPSLRQRILTTLSDMTKSTDK